jgi:hypothetical protein
MSIADKLATIAENEQKVYDAGYDMGYQAHSDLLWDTIQNNGKATNYANRFYGWQFGWEAVDRIYEPNHDFIHSSDPTSAFRENYIKDIIKDNYFNYKTSATTLAYTFYYATRLENARTLHVREDTKYTSPFSGCSKLTEVRFEGTIGQNGLNFSASPLSLESAISVITHLKNFTETAPDKAFTCTITFSPKTWEYLNADGEKSPNGTTWADYITALGWNS